jgi:hypothetical protein
MTRASRVAATRRAGQRIARSAIDRHFAVGRSAAVDAAERKDFRPSAASRARNGEPKESRRHEAPSRGGQSSRGRRTKETHKRSHRLPNQSK